MCDTLIAMPGATSGKETMLGKNSDRSPNEAQNVTFAPARDYSRKATVKCAYIEIPQVPHTNAVLLSRPFWMFGAEMGVNEHSVAIGNEAVFTKEKYDKIGLTGMDILRLALERTSTASEALELIIDLIEKYGQGGNCGYQENQYYHNSYIIADAAEAFVLETAGKKWVAKYVKKVASISNCLTIENDFDFNSPGLKKGVNFKKDFSDTIYTHFARGNERRKCSYDLLSAKNGKIKSLDMMNFLRDHNSAGPFIPGEKPMEGLCFHAGGLISAQTTGSMVAVLKKKRQPLVYFTGTSAPCLGIFKPHTLLPGQEKFESNRTSKKLKKNSVDVYGSASGTCDLSTLWWTGESIHRRVLMNYHEYKAPLAEKRDKLEKEMVKDVEKTWKSATPKKFQKKTYSYSSKLVEENKQLAESVIKEYNSGSVARVVPWWFNLYWKRVNRKSKFK